MLAPGEIELAGLIAHTPYERGEEIALDEATLEIGEIVASHAGVEDWYVYSGNDDPEFASNQHQGRRLTDEEFIWECQRLLRDGTFDLVMYYETRAGQEAILRDVAAAGYDVTGVEPLDSPDSTPKS